MGAYGWTMLADQRTVKGTLASWNIYSEDGDLCLMVVPRPEDLDLLTNPLGHVTNQNGQIECEVRPPDANFDSGTASVFLDPIVGRTDVQVTVTGVWVADNGHSYTGDMTKVGDTQGSASRDFWDALTLGLNEAVRWIPAPDPAIGKTELHPITSILIEYPPEAADDISTSRRVDFLVFSDDPTTWVGVHRPFAPPHSGESTQAGFAVPFPAASAASGGLTQHRFEVLEFNDQAEKASLSIAGDMLEGAVQTGPLGHFYVSLRLFTARPDPGQRNFVQGNWGQPGNYELLVPQGERIMHYYRVNDPGPGQFQWHQHPEISFAGHDIGNGRFHLGATPVSVSLLQSTFRGDNVHGNLDAIVRITPDGPDDTGDTLSFIALDSATGRWTAPAPVLVAGQPITGVTGD